MCVLVAQLCLTLCSPVDCSLPGFSVHRIFQGKILEWVVFSPPEDLPNPGIKSESPALYTDSLPSEPPVRLKDTHGLEGPSGQKSYYK